MAEGKISTRKNCNNRIPCIRNSLRAFTLTELIITVVIISLIAAFGIPNYTKTALKARERSAVLRLTTIHGANEIYRARSGGVYLPGAGLDLAAINTGLSINIIDPDMTYSYTRNSVSTYTATSSWTAADNFTVRVNQDAVSPGENPCCSAGSCPSLAVCP